MKIPEKTCKDGWRGKSSLRHEQKEKEDRGPHGFVGCRNAKAALSSLRSYDDEDQRTEDKGKHRSGNASLEETRVWSEHREARESKKVCNHEANSCSVSQILEMLKEKVRIT